MASTQRRGKEPFFGEEMVAAEVGQGDGEAIHNCSRM